MDKSRLAAGAAVLALLAGGGVTAGALLTASDGHHRASPPTSAPRPQRPAPHKPTTTTARTAVATSTTRTVHATTTSTAATTTSAYPPRHANTTTTQVPRRAGTTSTTKARKGRYPVSPLPTPSTTTTNPPVTVTTAGPGAVAQAETWEVAYVADAWCGPLKAASGHDLAVLEADVAKSTGTLEVAGGTGSLVTALTPATGQISVHTTIAALHDIDLATADAIVPAGAAAVKDRLTAVYCYGAPEPLTGFQVASGGTIDFEVSYGLTTASGHTTWWHLWWQVAPQFGPCPHGSGTCLATWDAPGAPVAFWAAPHRSVAPRYVVPGPESTWRLTTPATGPSGKTAHHKTPAHTHRAKGPRHGRPAPPRGTGRARRAGPKPLTKKG